MRAALKQDTLTLPGDAEVKIYAHRGGVPPTWVVIVARSPVRAEPESLRRPGGLFAILTHDLGMTWPDEEGEALAAGFLAQGGVAALMFFSAADALACKRRLQGGAA